MWRGSDMRCKPVCKMPAMLDNRSKVDLGKISCSGVVRSPEGLQER